MDGKKELGLHYIDETFSRSYAEHIKRIFKELPGKEDFHKLSLVCPITFARISQPVRFKFCTHISCMDKSSWEHVQNSSGHFLRCPECQKKIDKRDLMKDELLERILAAPETQDSNHVYIRYFSMGSQFAWRLSGGETSVDLTDDTEDLKDLTGTPEPNKRRRRERTNHTKTK